MAFSHGKNGVFKLNDTTALRDMSQYIQKVDVKRNKDTADVSALGNSSKAYVAGLRDATIQIDAKWDPIIIGWLNTIWNQDAATAFEWDPAGVTTGQPKLTGNCILTDYEPTGGVDDAVGVSFSLQVTGGVTDGTN